MYVQVTPATRDEPEVRELIGTDEEALDILIEHMEYMQECPEVFSAIDDYTDDEIELKTSDYLSDKQIDLLNDLFIASNEWTEEQIRLVLEDV